MSNTNKHNPEYWESIKQRIMVGDQTAYTYLYMQTVQELYAYGMSVTPQIRLVEDCIHDIFVDIHQRRERLLDVVNFRAYLFTALRYNLFRAMREEIQSVSFCDSALLVEIEDDTQQQWIKAEESEEKSHRIKQLLNTLNKHQREVVHLRFIEGLSYEEIAEVMSVNAQSVQNLIGRTIKKLKTVSSRKLVSLIILVIAALL